LTIGKEKWAAHRSANSAVLENEEPPEELTSTIAFTGFTKNRDIGRYGLFPPLPVDKQE
jgi:hypothetical protein